MGNVSCDMDSVVGSMLLSYYYHLREHSNFTPIINCSKELFPVKLEICQHLKSCQLDNLEEFVYDDELKGIEQEQIDEIALIDHNKLDVSQTFLEPKIRRIVDHHIDNNLYLEQLKEKDIKLIGSATTLVIDRFMSDFLLHIDKDLAYFMLAPIVLDSFFFDENLKDSKWTQQDLDAYNYLVKVADVDGKAYFDNLYNSISSIDLNLQLGVKNLLIKDFKSYFLLNDGQLGIGVSSTFVPMRILISHFGFNQIAESMESLMISKNLGFFAVLTNYMDETDNKYKKQLLIFQNEDICPLSMSKFNEFVESLEQNQEYNLIDKTEYKMNEQVRGITWEVGNIKQSRKNFEVLINQFYKPLLSTSKI
ncbi:UNKNOWN [Stylonychia lemnae]|uniref:Uncharacterized protein n=1 Tax=Stylonychia lemnae TaxID=5949 RepID=A0A077ZZR0_STYLE|nr:UNKNOWN [Stylonychia lemnae]|eukprot:CDW75375.1 UNKNOWN [Stylonychia lemnae]